jgi:M6 family metalloprotease-like protein
MPRSLVQIIALFLGLLLSPALSAAPLDGEWMDFEQPDRHPIQLKVFGDEFYARFEGADGYTVVKDPASGWYCYAELSADGQNLISTGLPYGAPPPAAGTVSASRSRRFPPQRGLKLAGERRRAIAQEKRRQFEQLSGATTGGSVAPAPPASIQPAALTGEVRGLTLLIQFPDVPGTIAQATVEAFCNQPGWAEWGNNGSVRDYWYDVSGGKLTYTNTVTGYYTAKQPRAYYTDPSVSQGIRAREIITEALTALEAQGFDFTSLSTDANGRIRAINAFYAGNVVNDWAEGLWPHQGGLSPTFYADGVRSGSYQISNTGASLRLGTFCHENGHMLMGWPDLYDYDSDSNGVGNYCLMASSGSTNPHPPEAWLRHSGGGGGGRAGPPAAPGPPPSHPAHPSRKHNT